MRLDGFLRTPLRGDEQSRLTNLIVTETPLSGDPDPAAPYPQTLELTFDLSPTGTTIQIAPLWEGTLWFVPAVTKGLPTVPAEVTPARFARWPVTGDLVLRTWAVANVSPSGLRTHLSSIDPTPTLVRYKSVRLTREFVFETLARAPKRPFDLGGARIGVNDPEYAQKRAISVLWGTGGLWCGLDPDDPTKDTAMLPMPVVESSADLNGAGAAGPYEAQIAVASSADEALTPEWFNHRPAYDDLAGVPLVPPAIHNPADLLGNPAHPAHSVIPLRAIYQAAPAAAFAPDQPAATPLRAALAAPDANGRRYRRLALRRPAIPGVPVGAASQRPFPAHRLCWRPASGGAVESLRLPLSGTAYVAVPDGTYRLWVIPRTADPAVIDRGNQIRLSLPQTPAGAPAAETLDVVLAAGAGAAVDAHLREYDSAMVWEGFRAARNQQAKLQTEAGAAWNVAASFDWIVPRRPARPPASALYGLFRESAGRHGLAPEFLQVVFFGEGGNGLLPAGGAFNPGAVLDAFGFVGLDLIVYRTGRLPVGRPPIPPEVPAASVDERAEYGFNLVTAGYVDPAVAAAVTWTGSVLRTEGAPRTIEVGSIAGWPAAIELVAAELHARLDEMTRYLAAKVPPVPVNDELARRFLAYLRFNTNPAKAKSTADNLPVALQAWTGPWPADNMNSRYNTLQRLAITQWQEQLGAYREALSAP